MRYACSLAFAASVSLVVVVPVQAAEDNAIVAESLRAMFAAGQADTGSAEANEDLQAIRDIYVVRDFKPIWVRDSGPGVPQDDREHVFERFGRSAVPEEDEGFGLGLSIVRAIALAHGGTVELGDGDPHGALFTLVIPLETAPAAAEDVTRDDDVAELTEELPIWHGS